MRALSKSNKYYLSILFIFLTFNVARAEVSDDNFITGFFKGIRPAMDLLTAFESGRGDVHYHMRTFQVRRDMAMQVAKGIEEESRWFTNEVMRVFLKGISEDINKFATPQTPQGDIDYYIDLVRQQTLVFDRASEKIADMTAVFVQEPKITTPKELGFLRGLRVAVTAMAVYDDKRGGQFPYLSSIVAWEIRTFNVRQHMAQSLANGIRAELSYVKNLTLYNALSEIANEITSVRGVQSSTEYAHIEALKQQHLVYESVRKKVESLVAAAEKAMTIQNSGKEGAMSCSHLL
ncbi:MAG: hypothetical protein ACK5WZ_08015 [Pseudobdellovibrionaceae bacterium]